MAIQRLKGKKRKMELTVPAIVMLAVSLALVVLSGVLIFSSVNRYRFKSNYRAGFLSAAGNRRGSVFRHLETVLKVDPANRNARVLYAKSKADGGDLDVAAENYRKVRPAGPTVHCGLGVIYLRKADAAEKEEEFNDFLSKARDRFGKAGDKCIESRIGRAHADLLEGVRKKDDALVEKARAAFKEIAQRLDDSPEARTRITKEGLVDFYSGYGRTLFDQDEYRPEAAQMFRACFAMAPDWPLPQANFVSMEAQLYANKEFTAEELQSLRTELTRKISDYRGKWIRKDSRYAALKEPWLNLVLSISYAYARAGKPHDYRTFAGVLLREAMFQERVEPLLLDVYVHQELFENSRSVESKTNAARQLRQ
ncbi:MAG: tetratricopeptide repeat protein, partial [Planctomycetota bacterium]